jgi:endo-1,4-beta-xylanase
VAEVYKDYFLFGNAVGNHPITNKTVSDMYVRYYNAVTAENLMKPLYMAPQKGVYNFVDSDTLVNWAENNGIAVHGHALVWHSQSAEWLTMDESKQSLTRAEAKANMEDYINNVAGKYAGRLISWDVVNEAFKDSVTSAGSWRDALRTNDSPWYRAYANGAGAGEDGSDYIYDAFVFARIADPHATLYYNDFNEDEQGKRDAIVAMTLELNEKWKSDTRNKEPNRLLIEGLGMQSHFFTDSVKVQNIEDTIKAFISTGAKVSVSELDIPYGSYSNYRSRTEPLNSEEEAKQADLYREIFKVYIKYSEHIERVTIWGLADPMSWRASGRGLPFDEYYAPKKAFWGIMEAAGVSQ